MLNAERAWGAFGHPDSAAADAYRRAHIVTIGGAHGIPTVAVRREAAPLFLALDAAAVTGLWGQHPPYPLIGRVPDDWGYDSRFIRGSTTTLSNHAGGLAEDLNSNTNPMTGDHVTHTDMPPWLIDYAENVLGLRWGGHYDGDRRDPMHFEVVDGPAEVQRRTHALLITHLARVECPDVRTFQALHGLRVDGDAGPATFLELLTLPSASTPLVPPTPPSEEDDDMAQTHPGYIVDDPRPDRPEIWHVAGDLRSKLQLGGPADVTEAKRLGATDARFSAQTLDRMTTVDATAA